MSTDIELHGSGGYLATGDKLTTENDVSGDLLMAALTMFGGPVAGSYGTAAMAGGAGAAAGAAGGYLTEAQIASIAAASGGGGGGALAAGAGLLTEAEIAALYAASGGGRAGVAGGGLAAGLTEAEIASLYAASGGGGTAAATGAVGAAGTAGLTEAQIAAMHAASGGGAGGGGFLSSLGSALGGTGTWGQVASAAGTALGSTSLDTWAKLAMGAAGAYSGSQGSGGDTKVERKEMDRRMAALVYGTGPLDTNGITGAAFDIWQRNKTGVNPTMQQGFDMQRALYTDPSAINQMRTNAQGLLSSPVAGKPFAQNPYQPPQGLLGSGGQPQQPQGGLLATQRRQMRIDPPEGMTEPRRMQTLPVRQRMY